MRNAGEFQNQKLNVRINGFVVPAIKAGEKIYLKQGDFEVEILPHELPILQRLGYQIDFNATTGPQAPLKLLEELWDKLLSFYAYKF